MVFHFFIIIFFFHSWLLNLKVSDVNLGDIFFKTKLILLNNEFIYLIFFLFLFKENINN